MYCCDRVPLRSYTVDYFVVRFFGEADGVWIPKIVLCVELDFDILRASRKRYTSGYNVTQFVQVHVFTCLYLGNSILSKVLYVPDLILAQKTTLYVKLALMKISIVVTGF